MGGLNVLPEMLAAFITPNHAVISPVIKRAATILEQWTGNPSLDEYQSRNPDRVRKQMAAVYTAITEQQIIYSTIPASFEEYGATHPAHRFRPGSEAGDLPGYGVALRLLPGSYRTECSPHHRPGTRLCRCLAGARDFSGRYN